MLRGRGLSKIFVPEAHQEGLSLPETARKNMDANIANSIADAACSRA